MSDTPRSDDFIGPITGIYMTEGEIAMCDFARQLERELNAATQERADFGALVDKLERKLNAAKAALSGRTVSCSNCNAMAEELTKLKKSLNNL